MTAAAVALGTRQVGEAQPCFVLAAVAAAHGGSAERALEMIEAAFKMGADGIAFQIFRAAELVVRRHPERKDLDRIELTAKEWKRVLKAARASGLPVLAEAFDRPSLELAAEAEVHGLLVPSGEVENPELVRAVSGLGRPVWLGASGVPEEALREALDLLGAHPAGLLLGRAGGAASAEELRLRELAFWKQRHRLPLGVRDGTDGVSAFALLAPALAAAHGADLVEKRFALDRSRKGPDYEAALSPEDFYRMVELLRQAERARGEGGPDESAAAPVRGDAQARSIVAGGLIPRGAVLTVEQLAFKRIGPRGSPGFSPREAHRVIGRRAARPIQADEAIREDMLE
jgi:sialic acid synthase SpsE